MALGALISAYQEDEMGGLQALLPLAGRGLADYQVRCAAGVGASPVVMLVERMPAALSQAIERLRQDGVAVVAVSDPAEAVSRFEPNSLILLVADGVAAPVELVADLVDRGEPTILTVPDEQRYDAYERIDAESRWAGLALVDSHLLSSTVAMLGDWDLQSTLLRKTVQAGAPLVRVDEPMIPLLASDAGSLIGFERQMLAASRGRRDDVASRFLLPPVEQFFTERLMETRISPILLMAATVVLTLAAAFAFTRGWAWPAIAMLALSLPLDRVAERLSILRLKPMNPQHWLRRLRWPAAGIALIALGWWQMRTAGDTGPFIAALAGLAFAEAQRIERGRSGTPERLWLFSRRNAVLAALPFAALGAWGLIPVALASYAALTFFLIQHVRHLPLD